MPEGWAISDGQDQFVSPDLRRMQHEAGPEEPEKPYSSLEEPIQRVRDATGATGLLMRLACVNKNAQREIGR